MDELSLSFSYILVTIIRTRTNEKYVESTEHEQVYWTLSVSSTGLMGTILPHYNLTAGSGNNYLLKVMNE